MTISEKIRKLRKEHGWTMKACAEKADIPFFTYQKYESGARELGTVAIKKLAILYNVSTDYLLGLEEETNCTPVEQLEESESEIEFLKSYLLLEPKDRAEIREQMRKTLKKHEQNS